MDAGIPAKRWSDRFPREPRQGDVVISWGEHVRLAGNTQIKLLNGTAGKSKFEQAQILAQAGIPTVEVSRTRPPQTPQQAADPAQAIHNRITQFLEEFLEASPARTEPYRAGLRSLRGDLTTLEQALAIPVPTIVPVEWLPRRNNHVGGNDLLQTRTEGGVTTPDYYSKKEDIVEEYRLHSFCGKSIRAGKKAPREGFTNPHPWIRAFDAGWRIVYDNYESTREQRDLSARACEELGLQFGAVDLGKRRNNSLVVLEVNRAPGLEGGTVTSYVAAIQKWLRGELEERRAA